MGSNMAEQHPVGFQWVIEAKERGAKVIHVDPRFTRTSAMADLHVQIRAGSDIAFLGGIVNYIFERDAWFKEYVQHYTNAPVVINPEFQDAEDIGGFFSGWDPETGAYDIESWGYDESSPEAAAGKAEQQTDVSGEQAHGAHGIKLSGGDPPHVDNSMQHERCVLQILRRHFARYTPELVSELCGCSQQDFLKVAQALCENSGRERTSAIAYAVGWTQHTVGVQNIRTAAIVQLLLGNIGRPGGGILALRGHANIQGSTDIPTLYNILPGYIPMPHPQSGASLEKFIALNGPTTGAWGNLRHYIVSLLKAWWGDAATSENDYCFQYLPRIDGDHSHYAMMLKMLDGGVRGMFCVGQNPAVGSANSKLMRLALAKLEWLVVRDFQPTESGLFWKDSPEHETGEVRAQDIQTEVFFLPAAAHTEKDGNFTNTQRLLQWHHKACDPPGDARSELHWIYHLGRAIRSKLADSEDPRDRPLLDLTWDYPLQGPHGEPDAAAVLQEISGMSADGSFLSSYDELKGDGSTRAGSWIHCGIYKDGVNQSARKRPGQEQNWIAHEWGWSWPKDVRILYNRASADPEGNPWSERKRYVWWDAQDGKWTSLGDSPDFPATKAPDFEPPDDAKALEAISGDKPFIILADGRGWLFAPTGLVDGPLPTHYEPQESPFTNPVYRQQHNPTRQTFSRAENPYHPRGGEQGAEVFPYVLTTYRLTEHHTAGGMSRIVPYLAELQPEFFCEVSPQLAAERGLEHAGWATIVTARQAIEARVLVTERIKPLQIQGRPMHLVGVPYHWGGVGIVTGDSGNELLPLALDNNVHISEYKAATCDIRPGRRPRGPARLELVEQYRQRAGVKT
ncbi:MAG: molybdopterin-dependent oxidoreductase [Solirubrobacterales bacterium]|nr:molybdopterin-dependent oxidoreductase [Solirubrobacterales bacterium]MBV9473387.1 molybdopterin-dependent oxidoreductase [Solirubrobacterales bacterium]